MITALSATQLINPTGNAALATVGTSDVPVGLVGCHPPGGLTADRMASQVRPVM